MAYRRPLLNAFLTIPLCVWLFISPSTSTLSFAENGGLTRRDLLKSELWALEEKTHPFVETFRKVVLFVGPSVVSIRTEKNGIHDGYDDADADIDLPGIHPHEESILPLPEHDMLLLAHGSGMIVDTAGHILTNYHVVEGFEDDIITVMTNDGRQFRAEIVGIDIKTDLGMLKIDAEGLEPVEFGNSDDVQVGDWVLTIGNPFGYRQTVSAGIVSGVQRKGVVPFLKQFSYEDFIQTDAAINPGNSGGPLVNLRGEVVGISTAIATRSGGFQGIGFAISAAIAQEVMKDLIEKGKVVRGYLGVGIRDIDNELAMILGYADEQELITGYGLDSTKGAFVSEVWDDTPAAKGGIKPGDIILMIDKEEVTDADTIQKHVRRTKVEATTNTVILRNKEKITLPIKIEEQPEDLADRMFLSVTPLSGPIGNEESPGRPSSKPLK
ncbi:MAG: S1C family serine protease [Planctomycetota bacterium]|jgi:serine protease Do